ncbi:hypothetical protein J6590_002313 [Homalodisca vitripennis]|nr:hypothetical protein J6590_002313 [Homalodisca vitripennis]
MTDWLHGHISYPEVFWTRICIVVLSNNGMSLSQGLTYMTKMSSGQLAFDLTRKRRKCVPDEVRMSEEGHDPEQTSCRRCVVCVAQRRTRWMCKVCEVPLCHINRRDCFKVYHSQTFQP